jgi:putative membrane protein
MYVLNGWNSGWGWILWMGIVFLFVSSAGNWGYTYRAHRRYDTGSKSAMDFLKERYAKGEINLEEFRQIKAQIQDQNEKLGSAIRSA